MKPTAAVPISTGIALYQTLKENFNIVLYSDQEKKTLDYWLSVEALNIHSAVEYNDEKHHWLDEPSRKLHQVNSLRHRGFKIEVVIEPDPGSSALLLNNGYNVLTYSHAQYALPQWRPDFTGNDRRWETLEAAANTSAELRALDTRLKKLDEKDDWK